VRQPDPSLLAALPLPKDGQLRDHIWLVDPLGNLMMRYPPDEPPRGMMEDIKRLLRLSRIG
jgi:hypothetical protein